MHFRKPASFLLWMAAAVISTGPATAQTSDLLFARIKAEPPSPFERQRLTLYLEIYSAPGIDLSSAFQISGFPPPEELLIQPFEELAAAPVMIGGQTYDLRRFRCTARAPKAGTIRLAPVVRTSLIVLSRTFFMTIREEKTVSIPVAPLDLVVRPIPAANRPPDYSDLVGRFAFSCTVAPTNPTPGDPVTITVAVSGDGDMVTMRPPRFEPGPLFKTYDPELDVGQSHAEKRVFRQTVVPLSTNAIFIAATSLSYFDPYEEAFRQVQLGPFHLTVQPEAPIAQAVRRPPPTASASPARDDAMLVKPVPPYWHQRQASARHPLVAPLLTLPFLAVFLAAVARLLRPRYLKAHETLYVVAILLLVLWLVSEMFMALRKSLSALPDEAASDQFRQAGERFKEGRFSEAVDLYARILADGHYAPELFHNLGTACWKAGRKGEAVLNYRRALLLAPRDAATRTMLRRLSPNTNAAIPFWRMASPAEQRIALVALYGLTAILLTMRLKRQYPMPWLTILAALSTAALIAGVTAQRAIRHYERHEAVVVTNNVPIRIAPSDRALVTGAFEEGEVVQISESQGSWIRAAGERLTGWIPFSEVRYTEWRS